MLVRVSFGEIHAVTEYGDQIKGKREITLACRGGALVVDRHSEHRYTFLNDEPSEHASCYQCRESLGLTGDSLEPKV